MEAKSPWAGAKASPWQPHEFQVPHETSLASRSSSQGHHSLQFPIQEVAGSRASPLGRTQGARLFGFKSHLGHRLAL